MPTFQYSATFDESVAMLGDLCGRGFRVILDRAYDQTPAPEYDRVSDELVGLLREGPSFYLAGSFTKHGVRLSQLGGDGPDADKYIIHVDVEGPLLSGMIARINPVGGVPTLLLGVLQYQDRYRNLETGERREASSEVKAAYKLAISTMKSRLIEHPTAKFPIGPEALRLVQEGKARLREYFSTPTIA
jgi:hypothetical protein